MRPWTITYRVMHASNAGVVSPVTSIKRDAYDEPHVLDLFHVTRDRNHVIASNGYAPLIWVAATNTPRATCFDLLTPSSSSSRFLGIEIDTRQFVIADEDFKILQRFDATSIPKRSLRSLGHPMRDMQSVKLARNIRPRSGTDSASICKPARNATWKDSHFPERRYFTGQKGEAIRIGKTLDLMGVYADGGGCGSYISILPDGDAPLRDIARFQRPGDSHYKYSQEAGLYPPVRAAPNCQLFGIAFPRENTAPGYRYYLVDRDGNKFPLGPDDQSQRVSPYYVIAIANRGKTIVACDDTRLFSIPVNAAKSSDELSQ